MTKLFLLLSLSISLLCGQNNSQSNPDLIIKQDSVDYILKSIAFIKQVKQQELSDKNFILSDKPFSFEYFHCIDNLLADTTFYTKNELAFIKDKKYPSIKYWTKEFFRNTILVSSDTITAIFKDKSKWWAYFYKNIGSNFNTFSVPIFLRNDTYCLFYSDHHCGGLCGGGQLALYKKEKEKWIKVKPYCSWIS
jgi:hypothetical protein